MYFSRYNWGFRFYTENDKSGNDRLDLTMLIIRPMTKLVDTGSKFVFQKVD